MPLAGLRHVLKDVETRFGAVALVFHDGAAHRQAVIASLRSRPEVAEIKCYGSDSAMRINHIASRQIAQR